MGDVVERELPCQRTYSVTREDAVLRTDVLDLAARKAFARGGQTTPLSDYDIALAKVEITGERSTISSLADEIEALEAENSELRKWLTLALGVIKAAKVVWLAYDQARAALKGGDA